MFRSLGANIWDHEMPIRFGGIPLWHRMTVIRLTNGGLVVHSPTSLDHASQEELQKLGPIVAIAAPSWWHDLYLREYLSAYPGARFYGAPTLVRWNRSVPFAEVLGDLAPSLWTGEIDQVHVQGIGLFLDEIVFYHRRSRSLIVADLLFNLSKKDAWITRTMGALVIGPFPGCRFARLYRPAVTDRRRMRAAAERILDWDFDQIIVGHGAVVENNGKEVFRTAFRWLLK
jgi:glyoxylase-like metal-dependent hydrolase (beta-lactamase superfamily II)